MYHSTYYYSSPAYIPIVKELELNYYFNTAIVDLGLGDLLVPPIINLLQ
jgi:hypothetical protein